MSLAKRNNGCFECRMRRVRCDKAEPECFKCRKKGIKCSGQGIECRFSSHMMRNQTVAGSSSGRAGASAKSSRSPKPLKWVNVDSSQAEASSVTKSKKSDNLSSRGSTRSSLSPAPSSIADSDMETVNASEADGDQETSLVLQRRSNSQMMANLLSPNATIEMIPSQRRMLFDHFSNAIASKMVVLDFNQNGYRQLILPQACQDETVGRAVSVIAAFHLAQHVPSLRMAAEVGQQEILSKLHRDSLNLEPGQLFSLSAWTTILVLLVGDTITGSNNYVYLLELLSRLTKMSAADKSLSDATRTFITEQTRMFELFGFPLSSERRGLETLMKDPEYYLGFMSSNPQLQSDPERLSNVLIMKEAIRQACVLYRNRLLRSPTSESSVEAVEQLRQTVIGLDPTVEGSHALVWAFFVAAAESTLPEHRDFFVYRLKCLHECTKFGSIPLALETLELIWASQGSSSWTEIVTRQRPILIM